MWEKLPHFIRLSHNVISFLWDLKKEKNFLNLRLSCFLTTNFSYFTFKTAFHMDSSQSPWILLFMASLKVYLLRAPFHFLPSISLQCFCFCFFHSMLTSLAALPIIRFKCLCVGLIPIFLSTSLLQGSEMEFQTAWIMPFRQQMPAAEVLLCDRRGVRCQG